MSTPGDTGVTDESSILIRRMLMRTSLNVVHERKEASFSLFLWFNLEVGGGKKISSSVSITQRLDGRRYEVLLSLSFEWDESSSSSSSLSSSKCITSFGWKKGVARVVCWLTATPSSPDSWVNAVTRQIRTPFAAAAAPFSNILMREKERLSRRLRDLPPFFLPLLFF